MEVHVLLCDNDCQNKDAGLALSAMMHYPAVVTCMHSVCVCARLHCICLEFVSNVIRSL